MWPASILMARYCVEMKDILERKVIVELGCGCGLPGLAAGIRKLACVLWLEVT